MTARVLPRAEWRDRLAGTYLETAWPHLPDGTDVVVVEQDGEVIGCWSAFQAWHLEGVWVREDKRKSGGVIRRLKRTMMTLLAGRGARMAFTASQTPEVDALITGLLRGVRLPAADHYVCPIRTEVR